MSTRFFTNHGAQTLFAKFDGIFASNKDMAAFDALVGYVRFKKQYMESIPIPPATAAEKSRLSDLARQAAAFAHAGDPDSLRQSEAEIDHLVCQLFHLTPAEIALVNAPR